MYFREIWNWLSKELDLIFHIIKTSIIIVVFLTSVLNVNASFIWAQKLENLDKIHDTKLESNL